MNEDTLKRIAEWGVVALFGFSILRLWDSSTEEKKVNLWKVIWDRITGE